MTEADQDYFHLKQHVRDLYEVGGHIASTRSADAYRGVDQHTGQSVCLWVLRHSLTINSDAVKRFMQRARALERLEPMVARILDFGVDSQGVAFAALPPPEGSLVISGRLDLMEAERRFVSCVRVVDALHRAGLVCGDLSGNSFWVKRGGEVELIGVMGSFDVEAAQTAMMPPAETIPFIAPEQRSGGVIGPATDVFALGVLGYFLFTQRFPFGEGPAALVNRLSLDEIAPISSLAPLAPRWCDEFMFVALNPNPQLRYGSAGEMLTGLNTLRSKFIPSESQLLPIVTKPKRISHDGEVQQFSGAEIRPKADSPGRRINIGLPNWALAVLFIVVIPSLTVVLIRTFKGDPPKPAANQPPIAEAGSGETGNIESASQLLASAGVRDKERLKQLTSLVSSDDPLAHELLVHGATLAETPEIRQLVERAIIDRALRLGLKRSADQVRFWLRSFGGTMPPANYEGVLRALDKVRPTSEQASTLRQAYPQSPDFVMKLAVALALDQDDLEGYQPLLAQLVGDNLQIADASQHSSLALILAHPQLGLSYGDDVVQRLKKIPNSDISWLLKILGDRGDSNVRAVASEARDRGELSPIRNAYLDIIKARSNLPREIAQVLVRAASGSVRSEDVAVIGGWYDLDGESVLLTLLTDTSDPALLSEEFDTLAGKNISSEPTATLLEWIRRDHWNDRLKAAQAVGILGSQALVTPARLDEALISLEQLGMDPQIIAALLKNASPALSAKLVARYPEEVGVYGILGLLGNSDKTVRIAAIKQLEKVNDVGASKMIIDNYEKEKDPEVKQAYKNTFWFIRERKE